MTNQHKDKWIESGWYDCCGGGWFLTYTLEDVNGNIIEQFSNKDDIVEHYIRKAFDMITSGGITFDGVDWWEVLHDSYVIEYDEGIDHSMDWTCMDD